MPHDFSRTNRCRWCGISILLGADTECSGNLDEATDETYDRNSDS